MFRFSLMWFIYNLYTRNIFYFSNKTSIINYCMCGICEYFNVFNFNFNNPLTWNGGSLLVALNFCLAGPMLRVNCSTFTSLQQPPTAPLFSLFPLTHTSTVRQMTLTCQSLLLSGTVLLYFLSYFISYRVFIGTVQVRKN
jgi:hypothetical protein